MIALTTTNDSLELVTGAALSTDYAVTYVETTSTTHVPGSNQGNVATATTTTIVAAPGAGSTYRGIKSLTVVNKGSGSQAVTIQKDVSGTDYVLFQATLLAGEMVIYAPEVGFVVCDRAGRQRMTSISTPATNGQAVELSFVSTSPEAASYHYFAGKDGTFWGPPWSPGSPGVNGRTTDGTNSADVGCLPLTNAPSGYQKYLTRWVGMAAQAQNGFYLMDVLWVNTGLSVTTTTAQAITTPTWPARDARGGTTGYGLKIGLYFSAAATNAAAISGSTVSYTNTAGTSGRTATLSASAGFQIPGTPVIGTLVWFRLQDGDEGVQSVQSITLGTSLVTGSISMIVARNVALLPLSNNITVGVDYAAPGVRIWDGACLLPAFRANTTTASDFSSFLQFVDL